MRLLKVNMRIALMLNIVVSLSSVFAGCSTTSKSKNSSSLRNAQEVTELPELKLSQREGEGDEEFQRRVTSRSAFREGIAIAANNPKSSKAAKAFQRAAEVDPEFGWPNFNLGVLAEASSNVSEAKQHYKDALEANAKVDPAVQNLGSLLVSEGREDAARSLFENAILENPTGPSGYTGLGFLYLNDGQYSKAESMAKDALRYDAGNFDAYRILALVTAETKRAQESYLYTLKAEQLGLSHPDIQYAKGLMALNAGREDEGRLLLKDLLEKEPSYFSAEEKMLEVALKAQDWPSVEDLMTKRAKRGDASAQTLNTLGVALKAQGKNDQAKSMFEKAIALDADESEAYWNLALVNLENLDSPEAAEKALDAYVAREPRAGREASQLSKDIKMMLQAKADEERMMREMKEAEEAEARAQAEAEGAGANEEDSSSAMEDDVDSQAEAKAERAAELAQDERARAKKRARAKRKRAAAKRKASTQKKDEKKTAKPAKKTQPSGGDEFFD